MVATNKEMDMNRFQTTIREFEKQNEMMSIREEVIQDSLIDAVSYGVNLSFKRNSIIICCYRSLMKKTRKKKKKPL